MRRVVLIAAVAVGLTGCGSSTAANMSGGTTSSSPAVPTVSLSPVPVSATGAAGVVVLTLSKPADGLHASTTFAVAGTSNSFEANTPWTLADSTSKVVRQGAFTAAGWGDHPYPFTGNVSVAGLPAGTYVFTIKLDDPSDGEGKPVPKLTRTIIVG